MPLPLSVAFSVKVCPNLLCMRVILAMRIMCVCLKLNSFARSRFSFLMTGCLCWWAQLASLKSCGQLSSRPANSSTSSSFWKDEYVWFVVASETKLCFSVSLVSKGVLQCGVLCFSRVLSNSNLEVFLLLPLLSGEGGNLNELESQQRLLVQSQYNPASLSLTITPISTDPYHNQDCEFLFRNRLVFL